MQGGPDTQKVIDVLSLRPRITSPRVGIVSPVSLDTRPYPPCPDLAGNSTLEAQPRGTTEERTGSGSQQWPAQEVQDRGGQGL